MSDKQEYPQLSTFSLSFITISFMSLIYIIFFGWVDYLQSAAKHVEEDFQWTNLNIQRKPSIG